MKSESHLDEEDAGACDEEIGREIAPLGAKSG
jgi:hypothetical protein